MDDLRPRERRRTATRLLVPIGVVAIGLVVVWKVVLPYVTVRQEAHLPTDPYDLGFACSFPGIAYVTAAAYEGPAPHPVKLPYPIAPSQLKDLPSAWRPDSVKEVQLIACADRLQGGDLHKDCKYGFTSPLVPMPASPPFSIFMSEGTYTVTLYELRTHRTVAQATLIGTDDECPSSIMLSPRTSDQLYTQLAATQYVEAFGSYVEK
jgi:hypothetical protein